MKKKQTYGVDGIVGSKHAPPLKNTLPIEPLSHVKAKNRASSGNPHAGSFYSYKPELATKTSKPEPGQQKRPRLSRPAALLQSAAIKAKQSRQRRTKEAVYRMPRRIPIVMAIIVATALLVVVIRHNNQRQASKFGNAKNNSNYNDGSFTLDEQQVGSSALNAYTVTSDEPRYLKIPKIGVYSRVVHIDDTSPGNSPSLNNIYDVGWLSASSKPGVPGIGPAIIGHMSGPTRHGALYAIPTLESGDEIIIERGDGKLIKYQVESVKQYPNDSFDLQKIMNAASPAGTQLKIITTQGSYNIKTNTFEDRTVVYATQV